MRNKDRKKESEREREREPLGHPIFLQGGMMATHPDQAEAWLIASQSFNYCRMLLSHLSLITVYDQTLDYVPPDLAAGSMPAPFGTEEVLLLIYITN